MPKDLSEDLKIQFDNLKGSFYSNASQIKTFILQGRGIAEDHSKLFLYKGMYLELKPCYTSFCDAFNSLKELCTRAGLPDLFPTKDDRSLFKVVQEYYYEGLAIYENYMNPTPVAPTSSADVSAHLNTARLDDSRVVRARLPQINLPLFSGDPTDWPLFRDTYSSLIHNEPTLSDMEKFLFLISCLKGSARSLISNVSLTADNYSQAWNLLKTHFDNRRKLAYTYLQRILEYKPLSGKPTVDSFKSLMSSVVEGIESLRLLKIENLDDLLLSYLLLRCLDTNTRMAFEKKYFDVEFPTYTNLTEFIKAEWKSMEMMSCESNPSSSFSPSSSHPQRQGSRPKNSFLVGTDNKS